MLKFNFSTQFNTFSKKFQFNSTLFKSSTRLELKYSTWRNQSSIDYQKLNVIIKRNCYSLSLINEMINKIVDCKHLTQLNIISTFNKLQMHSDSENYTIFIIVLEAYKSKMLLFKLINDSILFQQYMNDILWNFLNDFCQVYLDDILIYSKTQWEHKQHVKMILNCLWKADLQMNIWKCEFNVEEIVFLEVIVSEQNLRMNFIKVKVIVNWTTLINLKEVCYDSSLHLFFVWFHSNWV